MIDNYVLTRPTNNQLSLDQRMIAVGLDEDIGRTICTARAVRVAPKITSVNSDERYKLTPDKFKINEEESIILENALHEYNGDLEEMYRDYKRIIITGKRENSLHKIIFRWDTIDKMILTMARIQQLLKYQTKNKTRFIQKKE